MFFWGHLVAFVWRGVKTRPRLVESTIFPSPPPPSCDLPMSTVTETVSLDQLIEAVVLPALPQTAMAMMQLEQDPEAGPSDFARILESDPGLTGQVLRFANSSYFGFSRTITSLPQTLMLVGVRTVTSFSLWNAVFSQVPDPSVGHFNLRQLWQDSLRRAVAARAFGKELRVPNPEELFVGALLQDMAIPVLLKELPQLYNELLQERAERQVRLSQLEDKRLGWNHGTAAALLAKRWQLPGRLMELVRTHTDLHGGLALGEPGPGLCRFGRLSAQRQRYAVARPTGVCRWTEMPVR